MSLGPLPVVELVLTIASCGILANPRGMVVSVYDTYWTRFYQPGFWIRKGSPSSVVRSPGATVGRLALVELQQPVPGSQKQGGEKPRLPIEKLSIGLSKGF